MQSARNVLNPVAGPPAAAPEKVRSALCAGDIADAERVLRLRLLEAPSDVGAIAKLADLAAAQGKVAEATNLLRRALAIEPGAYPLRLELARLLQSQGLTGAALAEMELLPSAVRSTFDVMVEQAALLGNLGRRSEEVELYEQLLRQKPRNVRLWISIATALNYSARTGEAVHALRRATRQCPSSGEPWWSLANLKSFRFDDHDIRAMQRALRNASAADAIYLHFALGSAFEQRRDHERSFTHYDAGNRIRASSLSPEQMEVTAHVDASVETFDAALFDRFAGAGHDTRGPIFVVGLQRSGTTLLEQILSSHPLIEATTELPAMPQLWDEVGRLGAAYGRTAFEQLAHLEPAAIRELGEQYLERARPFRQLGRPHFVDKLPPNWLNLGLIRLALPNARIIDARRHPMACGFSNFKQLYAFGVTYSYSLPTIGRFYRDYLRLMNHFDEVQPGTVLHVVNEGLIEDPEREVRRMLDFVGVPFDASCLDFHRNSRAVHTPSAEQVRRPLNRDGVDAWRPYEPWLAPLRSALGPAYEGWLPGRDFRR